MTTKYFFLPIALLIASCQTYEPLPLESGLIFQQIEKQRQNNLKEMENFSFTQAAELMSRNNLQLKAIKEQYNGFKNVAAIKTPLPNPTIEAGAAIGRRISSNTAATTQPFISLGFTIPLGPRLKRNDELNKALEHQAWNNVVMDHRELNLELRRAYIGFSLTKKLQLAQNEVANTLQLTKKTSTKLMNLGSITSLALNGISMQIITLQIEQIQQQIGTSNYVNKLSKLLLADNKSTANLTPAELPPLTLEVDLEELKKLLLKNNLKLAESEMKFRVADARLRLALAKQYPDLNVGIAHENEPGEKKQTLSLPFSIELPVFDRNSQEISKELSQRQSALTTYKKELAALLSEIENEYSKFKLIQKQVLLLENELTPLINKNLNGAQRALKFGSINILRYLDLVTESQTLKLREIQFNKTLWHSLLSLENLCGSPLINLDKPLLENK